MCLLDDVDDSADGDTNEALRRAGLFLVDVFAAGNINTRGVEYRSDSGLALIEPLPLIWWKRVVEWGDEEAFDGNRDLPVHQLAWEMGQLRRIVLDGETECLATITNIEVDLAALETIAPASGEHAAVVPKRRQWAAKVERRAKVLEIAQQDIGRGKVEAFLKRIADAFVEAGHGEIDTKTVRRYLFGPE
jgi:hypothetical protein